MKNVNAWVRQTPGSWWNLVHAHPYSGLFVGLFFTQSKSAVQYSIGQCHWHNFTRMLLCIAQWGSYSPFSLMDLQSLHSTWSTNIYWANHPSSINKCNFFKAFLCGFVEVCVADIISHTHISAEPNGRHSSPLKSHINYLTQPSMTCIKISPYCADTKAPARQRNETLPSGILHSCKAIWQPSEVDGSQATRSYRLS